MLPYRRQDRSPGKEAAATRPFDEQLANHRFWWGFWVVLGLALVIRLFWLELSQNFIGADATRYLWISQHVSRGEWHLLPQLYTSPLLPTAMGLLAQFNFDHLWAGRIIGILSNTTAVGLAMLLVRRLFPDRLILAWLTGLGLAVNHVWCRLAPFVLTDNLFYLLLIALFLLLALLLEEVNWFRGFSFGLVWGLLFLSREIGLYCGGLVFCCLLAAIFWRRRSAESGKKALLQSLASVLPVLSLILILWGAWYYHTLGIISVGEGRLFYSTYTVQFDQKIRHPYYKNGMMSFFQLRPYELMEYTRFPPPGDERFPPSGTLTLFKQPFLTFQIFWDNLVWSYKEFQRATLIGCLSLFLFVPLGLLTHRLSLPSAVYWVFGASLGILGLHFLGPIREARLVGWFFPWLYLGLAGFTLWVWGIIQTRTWESTHKNIALALLGGLFLFHILYPQYFKEVPRRWPLRHAPQVHILAGETIKKTFGPSAVIASREPEVVYRSGGYWIGLPYGTATELVEWLYLGGANYVLLHDLLPIPEEEKVFWSDIEVLRAQFPELEVIADFNLTESSAYGKNSRLLRFQPQPLKLDLYRQQYPWVGRHPRTTGAWAPD